MNHLFWGLSLVLLDVNLTLGTASFELLPDFLGFFLMMKGMEQLAGENRCFDRGRHLAFGLSVAFVIFYVSNLIELETGAQIVMWVLGLAALIAQLILLKQVVEGIRQMELAHGWDLRSQGIRAVWKILAVLSPLCHLLNWVPLVGSFCWTAALLTGVLFLAAFHESRRRYAQCK